MVSKNMPVLLDYVIYNFYPEIDQKLSLKEKTNKMMEELIRRTALMCAKWQSVGFCHGVLNTDNMSIIGVTLDYGPYGFMEYFDQKHICNHSDNEGRYRYEAQPDICLWNLQMLRTVLTNYIDLTAEETKAKWDKYYHHFYQEEMCKKLGLETASP